MIINVLQPAVMLGGVGAVLGAVLAVASVLFRVEEDERLPLIIDALPGANCGGCGYAGCSAYAGAVVSGGAALNLCPVGGAQVQSDMAEIMGLDAGNFVPKKAVVMCLGNDDDAVSKFHYVGIMDCAAANRVGGGPKSCSYGCLGLGSCEVVCPTGAIKISNGLAEVAPEKCISCGACINACPRQLITFWPDRTHVSVRCKSQDKGALAKKYCTRGCIGCRICEKVCEYGAITVLNNIAEIDPDKCTNCGACVAKCPVKCIVDTDREEVCDATGKAGCCR